MNRFRDKSIDTFLRIYVVVKSVVLSFNVRNHLSILFLTPKACSHFKPNPLNA